LPRRGNQISIAVNVSTRLLPRCGRVIEAPAGLDKTRPNKSVAPLDNPISIAVNIHKAFTLWQGNKNESNYTAQF
jgi:hypothetical protein